MHIIELSIRIQYANNLLLMPLPSYPAGVEFARVRAPSPSLNSFHLSYRSLIQETNSSCMEDSIQHPFAFLEGPPPFPVPVWAKSVWPSEPLGQTDAARTPHGPPKATRLEANLPRASGEFERTPATFPTSTNPSGSFLLMPLTISRNYDDAKVCLPDGINIDSY